MRVGIVVPQGLEGEYAGWEPARAWQAVASVGRQAEELGFDSVWAYDHVGTFGEVRDQPSFEAFAVLGALVAATSRLRVGPLVARAGFRNPALLARHISSLDVISGGRMELGLGAGATRQEALAYGFPFPDAATRMARLRDELEVVSRLLTDGRGTYPGEHARIDGALNNPRGLQSPRVPIIVGGNGPTARRLAAEFADELNLDGPAPADVRRARSAISAACEDAGRDPGSLALSVHVLPAHVAEPGDSRVRLLAGYREAGVDRVMALLRASVGGPGALELFARDARLAGAEL